MQFNVNGKIIATNEQGFLLDLDDWNEDFARALAQLDGVEQNGAHGIDNM